MEIFKIDILKNEFEKFQKENLVEILNVAIVKRLPANIGIENS